ncbi:MAG: hypothetical protein QOF51_2246 [Chloroflexota bacterium]|jgi:MFS family permease|nr:hypothetical protein [Chloroflexota bacterium]
MTQAIKLLMADRRSRWFFGALTQSSLGTGAAYVALLVVAYDRYRSPWAISLVLLADFVPAMVLGPVLGAAVDRWSRRGCAIAGDVIRAIAFAGIAASSSFPLTVAFALLAGLGTALFRPATLAALPGLAGSRTAEATSLYGAISDLGYTVGPAVGAAVLAAVGPEDLLVVNAVTFAASAAVLARLDFGTAPAAADPEPPNQSLIRETREGIRAVAGLPAIGLLLTCSAAAMFSGGAFNVAELPFAIGPLGTTSSGYATLVALYGLGFIAGSLRGSRGGQPARLKRQYVLGLLLTGLGGLAAGFSSGVLVALAGFTLSGFGNGLWVVHQRLLIQADIPAELQGRVFGLADGMTSWALAAAFVGAGAMVQAIGPRTLVTLTAVWEICLAVLAALALRRHWQRKSETSAAYGSIAQQVAR